MKEKEKKRRVVRDDTDNHKLPNNLIDFDDDFMGEEAETTQIFDFSGKEVKT